MNKNEILNKLKELKPIYQNEGLEILGVFEVMQKKQILSIVILI